MNFSEKFLDDLRHRIVLSDVIGAHVRLKRKGKQFKGLCPFHSEKTPSFNVHDEKGFYHCFGCKASGDVYDFVMHIHNFSFGEAVQYLAEQTGMPLPISDKEEHIRPSKDLYAVLEAACQWFQAQLQSPKGRYARDYLHQRGITDQKRDQFRLGFSPPSGLLKSLIHQFPLRLLVEAGLVIQPEDPTRSSYERFHSRVIFPIHDRQGRVIGFGGRILGEGQPKYLNSPDTVLFNKGEHLYAYPYAQRAAHQNQPVLITEGYLDVLTLHQYGFEGAMASLGTALTEKQVQLAWRLSSNPILCFDGDKAGQDASSRVALNALGWIKPECSLNFIRLPEGEDPDSLLRSGGMSQLKTILAAPRPLIEMVWHAVLEGKDLKTPEQRTLVKKKLVDALQEIKDSDLREEYRRTLIGRFTTFVRENTRALSYRDSKNPLSLKGGGIHSRGAVGVSVPGVLTVPNNPRTVQLKILLATIFKRTELLGEVIEQLGSLRIEEPTLAAIQQAMLMYEESSAKSMIEFVQDRGCNKQALSELLSPILDAHIGFAHSKVSFQEVLEGWQEVYYRYQERDILQQEFKAAVGDFAQNASARTWEQVKLRHHHLHEEAEKLT